MLSRTTPICAGTSRYAGKVTGDFNPNWNTSLPYSGLKPMTSMMARTAAEMASGFHSAEAISATEPASGAVIPPPPTLATPRTEVFGLSTPTEPAVDGRWGGGVGDGLAFEGQESVGPAVAGAGGGPQGSCAAPAG